MNLIKFLAKGHSKALRDQIVHYVGNDPARFDALMEVSFSGVYRLTQRASWPITVCVERDPALIKPYLKKLLKVLKDPDQHDSVRRNSLRLLQYVDLPRSLEGVTADICFDLFLNKNQPIAVRVFSMTVLASLAGRHPGLKSEVVAMIEDELPFAKPAIVSRAKKLLKDLKV